MIVIESSVLLTVSSTIVSVIVSVAATWYFARRHYTKRTVPITRQEIELEKVKNEFRSDALVAVFLIVFFGLLIGMLPLLIYLAP